MSIFPATPAGSTSGKNGDKNGSGRRGLVFSLLLFILVAAACLRLHRLAGVSLDPDEGLCVKMIAFSVPEIWTRSTYTPPPLYYLVLKGWSGLFGTSPFASRLLSVLLGLATVLGVFLFVRDGYRPTVTVHETNATPAGSRGQAHFSARRSSTEGVNARRKMSQTPACGRQTEFAALVAAALVALSPFQIVWSQEVRMYVLGACLTAFSSWFLLRALRRDGIANRSVSETDSLTPSRAPTEGWSGWASARTRGPSGAAVKRPKCAQENHKSTTSVTNGAKRNPPESFGFRTVNQPSSVFTEFGFTRDWCGFTLTTTLLAYTHSFALSTVAAQYLFAIGALLACASGRGWSRLRMLKPVVVSAMVFWFLWSPWLPTLVEQSQLVSVNYFTGPLSLTDLGRMVVQAFSVPHWGIGTATVGLVLMQAIVFLLVFLLLGRRMADVYIVVATGVPLLLAVGYCVLVRNILTVRYLLFTHVLLMAGMGVLLARIPWRPLRYIFTGVVLIGAVGQCRRAVERRAVMAGYPGMSAVMAKLDRSRNANEPVLVCNPMLFMPAWAYTKRRTELFTYRRGHDYPWYQFSFMMRPEEYFGTSDLQAGGYTWVWTLDAENWMGGTWRVSMPSGWRQVAEEKVDERYCQLVMRLYRKDASLGLMECGD